mmetsp:Transcript_684/g.1964  ORF Transcript_684/g.1964 Transcript_684/m.1964 type:complete len:312 (-) Transcript_684:392-1327(-)
MLFHGVQPARPRRQRRLLPRRGAAARQHRRPGRAVREDAGRHHRDADGNARRLRRGGAGPPEGEAAVQLSGRRSAEDLLSGRAGPARGPGTTRQVRGAPQGVLHPHGVRPVGAARRGAARRDARLPVVAGRSAPAGARASHGAAERRRHCHLSRGHSAGRLRAPPRHADAGSAEPEVHVPGRHPRRHAPRRSPRDRPVARRAGHRRRRHHALGQRLGPLLQAAAAAPGGDGGRRALGADGGVEPGARPDGGEAPCAEGALAGPLRGASGEGQKPPHAVSPQRRVRRGPERQRRSRRAPGRLARDSPPRTRG